MSNIVEIIRNLSDLLSLMPATPEQITEAEHQLGIRFSEEYKDYLSHFGAIMADGIELTGIAKSPHRNVVTLTMQEHNLNPKVPNTMYVVENTCIDGIIIWQDEYGEIYRSGPNTKPQRIAPSLSEYIVSRT